MVEKLEDGKYKITHCGKSITTIHYMDMEDSMYNDIVNEFYSKPARDVLLQNLRDIKEGKCGLNNINRYYFRSLMAECGGIKCKWSVAELLASKELVGMMMERTIGNVFYEKYHPNLYDRFLATLQMSGKGIAVLPGSFPLKTVDQILQKYNLNGNYYDFSCGWGVRLLGALRNNINYFGTDPNYKLTEQLHQLVEDYKEANTPQTESLWGDNTPLFPSVDIRTHGSEDFVSEWVGKMGVAFTSTPYFNIEDYRYGNQSWKEGTTLEQWLNNYMFPTFDNIFQYLVDEGHCLLNIKEPPNVFFIDRIIEYAKSIGFVYLGKEVLQLAIKTGGKNDGSGESVSYSSDEGIYVFKKTKNPAASKLLKDDSKIDEKDDFALF